MKKNQPTDTTYQVIEREKDLKIWSRVGAAWMHQDGEGFNLVLMLLRSQEAWLCARNQQRIKGHKTLFFK